jgi:hypothetical protein
VTDDCSDTIAGAVVFVESIFDTDEGLERKLNWGNETSSDEGNVAISTYSMRLIEISCGGLPRMFKLQRGILVQGLEGLALKIEGH